MLGNLFPFGSHGLCAFLSPPFEESRFPESVLVFVAGLGEGLLAVPYIAGLGAMGGEQWSLCQPLLRTSYNQFGFGSLDSDAADLEELLDELVRRGAARFALVGHSTGCQSAVRLTRRLLDGGCRGDLADRLALVVLQAPVSDRQSLLTDPPLAGAVEKHRAQALEMREAGRGDALLPRDVGVMTATRFLELFVDRGQGDDMFSTDIAPEQWERNLGHLRRLCRVLAVLSDQDEFVAESVRPLLDEHFAPFVSAVKHVAGSHNLSQPREAQEEFLRLLREELEGISNGAR